MFHMDSIPKEAQLRDVLDQAPTDGLKAIFSDYLNQLQRGRRLESFQFLNGSYLVPLDGSEYFSSKNISCPGCLKKEKPVGDIRYHHQILQAVIVHPDIKQVLPVAPEPIQNKDGYTRIVKSMPVKARIREDHPRLKIIITWDGLYCSRLLMKSKRPGCLIS